VSGAQLWQAPETPSYRALVEHILGLGGPQEWDECTDQWDECIMDERILGISWPLVESGYKDP
jgi:hypothetical protein